MGYSRKWLNFERVPLWGRQEPAAFACPLGGGIWKASGSVSLPPNYMLSNNGQHQRRQGGAEGGRLPSRYVPPDLSLSLSRFSVLWRVHTRLYSMELISEPKL